jgi:hypothetical protein
MKLSHKKIPDASGNSALNAGGHHPSRCRHVSNEYFLCGLPCGTRILLCPACYYDALRKVIPEKTAVSVDDPRAVKRASDFLAIAGRYMRLRRAGRQWRGLCPFHKESSPSLYIEPGKKIWKCFGCARGGDVFDFVMLAEGCDFPSALRVVSGFSGVGRAASGEAARASRASEGAQPLSGPKARVTHSPDSRDSILDRLAETERRCENIKQANAESFAEFERDCEPHDGDDSLLFINKRTTGHE